MSHFNKLVQRFDKSVVINETPIVIDTLFDNKQKYQDLYNELYQSVLNDYGYRKSKVWLSIQDIDLMMSLNSLIVHMIFWKPFIVFPDAEFTTDFFVDTSHINSDIIANYLDLVIEHFITDTNQEQLNEVISEIRDELSWISLDFNPTIGNTINLHDKISLSKRNERYNDLIHTKLDENMTMEEIEHEIDERTNELVSILKTEDNCFRDYLGSGEGINKGQLSQFEVSIGAKPDPKGRVFPKIVNTNFITGGLQTPSDYFIDASGGRKASIINFSQVKVSGYLTRKLSLLCMNTILDTECEDCGSTNYVHVLIDYKKTLGRLNGRSVIYKG